MGFCCDIKNQQHQRDQSSVFELEFTTPQVPEQELLGCDNPAHLKNEFCRVINLLWNYLLV